MNKFLYIISLAFTSVAAVAQVNVNGIVKDAKGEPMIGIRVSEVGDTRNSCLTDEKGEFSLSLDDDAFIELNYADVVIKRMKVSEEPMHIVLDKNSDAVVDFGFFKRNELNSTQATSVIYADRYENLATSTMRVNNSLFGLLSGFHSTQKVGWGANAGMNIRGLGSLNGGSPLVLVDGFPRDITNMTIEEIESIQVLKDGAATALYGARAANGVLLINTKRGIYNSFDVDVNYRHGFDFPINELEMADAYTYARAQNEALYYDGLPLKYTQSQLNKYQTGADPYYYPNVNWYKEGTRNFSENNQFNIIMRGGGSKVRYFALLDYKNKFGLLNEDYTNYSDRYNSQIRNYELDLRMNLDADVTSSTKLKFNLFGIIGEDKRPNTSINDIFNNFYKVPAAAFPIKTLNNNWGSNTLYKMNPLAEIADVGYVQENRRLLEADMRITQDLSMLLKGLSAEVAVSYDNSATYQDIGRKTYRYEVGYISDSGQPVSEIYDTDGKLQITSSKLSAQFLRANLEAKLNFDRTFGNHQLMASAIYRQEMEEPLEIRESYYRQNVMGLLGYNYKNRYMMDMVANYYGTSVLLKGDKFRFYPAVSAGWNISEEDFMDNVNFLDLLKLRFSWGRSASDDLSYGLGNYFWVSGGNYAFGEGNDPKGYSGLKEGTLPMTTLNLETADKFNVGLDLRLWRNLTASAELYYDHRTNILVNNNDVSGIIGATLPKQCSGIVNSRGVEFELGWNKEHRDFKYYANANISFNDSEIVEDGQAFQPYDYLYTKGHKIGQLFGLEAIGYFEDEQDILNSPEHTFSQVRPGDVKYKDQNDDGKIDSEDRVAIGKSTSVPDMFYGLNLGFEYKGFGIDLVFNGVNGITKLLNVDNVHRPLRNGNTNISTWYLKDRIRWTEQTKYIANVPRLSTLSNENNYQTSTQWIEDGSFFKLRNLNVYYELPKRIVEKVHLDKCKLYVRANNLFSIDKIDYFNCEDMVLGYPDLFSLYLGLNINF